jgi:hypothetical protein
MRSRYILIKKSLSLSGTLLIFGIQSISVLLEISATTDE